MPACPRYVPTCLLCSGLYLEGQGQAKHPEGKGQRKLQLFQRSRLRGLSHDCPGTRLGREQSPETKVFVRPQLTCNTVVLSRWHKRGQERCFQQTGLLCPS